MQGQALQASSWQTHRGSGKTVKWKALLRAPGEVQEAPGIYPVVTLALPDSWAAHWMPQAVKEWTLPGLPELCMRCVCMLDVMCVLSVLPGDLAWTPCSTLQAPPLAMQSQCLTWTTWLFWQVLWSGGCLVPKALRSPVHLCWKHEAHVPQHTASPAGGAKAKPHGPPASPLPPTGTCLSSAHLQRRHGSSSPLKAQVTRRPFCI